MVKTPKIGNGGRNGKPQYRGLQGLSSSYL